MRGLGSSFVTIGRIILRQVPAYEELPCTARWTSIECFCRIGDRESLKCLARKQHPRTTKRGMRFRREQDFECHGRSGDTWPSWGEMYRNVVWRTGGVEVEGGHHRISRNTIAETGPAIALPLHGYNAKATLDDAGRDFATVFDIVYDNGKLNLSGTCSCNAGKLQGTLCAFL